MYRLTPIIFFASSAALLLMGCSPSLVEPTPEDLETIRPLVSELSWESIGYANWGRVYLAAGDRGKAAAELVHIGTRATSELLQLLEDPERGVAAHLVLCAIWDPYLTGGSSERVIYEGSKIIGFSYEYRGLSWTCLTDRPCSADPSALAENAERWRQRIDRMRLPNPSSEQIISPSPPRQEEAAVRIRSWLFRRLDLS